jgi:hypothetical protein
LSAVVSVCTFHPEGRSGGSSAVALTIVVASAAVYVRPLFGAGLLAAAGVDAALVLVEDVFV